MLSELGEPETMAGKDKVYAINPTAHSGGPFYHGSEPALLPIVAGPGRAEAAAPSGSGRGRSAGQSAPERLHGRAGQGDHFSGLVSTTLLLPKAGEGRGLVSLPGSRGCGAQRNERGEPDYERSRRRPLRGI